MEAFLYEALENGEVRCRLCRHRCTIAPGKRGICAVRENRDGVLHTLVYARAIARHIDPIEKKPLFHFLPGSRSYSIATVGCNFKCRFCQNSDIAQMPADHKGVVLGDLFPPDKVVAAALAEGCRSISYTYTEPTVFFEYAYDCAKLAKEKNLKNVFVTNGYESPEAIEMIAPFLDAANVDLKAFNEKFYSGMVGGKLAHVCDTLKRMVKKGIFVEVTTLLIPRANDDPKELAELACFIVRELGPQVPWHISAFHPAYKLLDRPRTPPTALFEARRSGIHPYCITIDREAKEYLPHMYGHANWVEIDDVKKLPLKVADIYRRLTT